MSLKSVRDFLTFWERLPDRAKTGPEKDAWVAELRGRIDGLPSEPLAEFGEIWRRRYEEQEATRTSAASRGGALFVLVGLLTASTSLVATSATGAWWPWQVAMAIVGSLLLVSAFAVAFLAVRSQQVTNWDTPRVDPEAGSDERTLRSNYAVEVMVAAEQNRQRVRNIVGYLRDAQRWALLALFLFVILAPLSIAAAASKPPSTTAIAPVASDGTCLKTPIAVSR